jgi:hypothetical protein
VTCYHERVRWVERIAVVPIFAILVGVAAAAPQVEIKAQTELSLSHVRLRDAGDLEVTGRLVDKLTGEGIPFQHVVVTVGGEAHSVTTAQDGTFHHEQPGEAGPQEIELGFRGASRLEPAAPLAITTDPSKAQLDLSIGKLGDDAHGARIIVGASGDEGRPAAVPVAIQLAGETGTWKMVRTVQTGVPFMLSRKDAGGPGQFRVRATFAGDAVHQRATAESTLDLTAATATSMTVQSTRLAYEDDLVVTGKVTDEDGRPVARAAVALTSGDRRLAQGASGDDGGYRFRIEAEILGECPQRPCTFGVQVQADPNSSYLRPSRSSPAVLTVAAPQPVPVSYTVVAFLATALAAGGFFAARNKPWRRLRRPAPPAEVPRSEGEVAAAETGGLVAARPGVMSTLRRASDDGFSGVVRDTVRGRPVADAIVYLRLGELEREIRTAGDGSFALDKLAAGEWRAEVAAAGHVTERFALTIPHRGELRGVRIDLVPVRERVFQLYRRAAEPVLPESRLWGIWSPRQIVDHVRSRRPSPALADLTDFVEEIYFSPRLAAETVLPVASERVDRAIEERARR